MKVFVALSFVALAVAYWAASGGSAFEPEAWPDAEALAAGEAGAADGAADVEVTRAEASTEPLAAIEPVPVAPTLDAEAVDAALAVPEAVAAPATLPEEPLEPGEALAALAPDLAAEAASATDAGPVVEASATLDGEVRRVTGDNVNLREGPGTGFAVVGRLSQGDAAQVVERRDGWARVRAGATEGWMSARFLDG